MDVENAYGSMWSVGMSEQPGHDLPPQALDEHASKAGLRTVAVFEAAKGLLVLATAATLIAVHHRVEDFAEDLLNYLHVDFDRQWAQALINGASKLSDMRLWTILTVACSYATVHCIEAWGLWHRRVWAEWFALLSGAIYLPIEILKVSERASWERIAVLVINLVIVLYMLEIRVREMRLRRKNATRGTF
jgi:uncharacterized membrane protein (DUF2068 family)